MITDATRDEGAQLAITTIQEEDVYSLSSRTEGEGWGEEAELIEYPSPLALSPLVPRGAREKISGGCTKMRPFRGNRKLWDTPSWTTALWFALKLSLA